MVTRHRRSRGVDRGRTEHAAGFTLVELLVAMSFSIVVLGAAAVLAGQMQQAYRRQIESAAAQQEARYVLDWIGRYVRGAGNNPYHRTDTDCPSAGTPVIPIRMDPDGDGVHNDVRIQTDAWPANGQVGGAGGTCLEGDEDVTIAYDAAAQIVTLTDHNLGTAAPRTDAIVTGLNFIYRDVNHNVTAVAANVAFVEIGITVRSRLNDPTTNTPVTYSLSSEVRVRNQ